jgi:putative ABC transport system permease protein
MNLHNIIAQAFQSLATNRLRSALTMLGVVWGTASVVFLLGWGKGFIKVMETETRAGGDGYVVFWAKRARSETAGRKGARPLIFELKDIDVVRNHCPSVRYVTPTRRVFTLTKYENKLKSGQICGVNADALNIYNLSIEEGRFLQPDDVKYQRRVIVLGADLKEALFPPGLSAIGRTINIMGISLEVIGTLKKKGDVLITMYGPDDEKAYVPITSMLQYVSGSRDIGQIDFQPKDPYASKACIREVKTALAKELNFSPDDDEALEIFDLTGLINSLDTMSLILAVFVTMVGVITLFVGAVGVMNIMLISVTERTREIGICKAIGAKRKHILAQFLAEAMTITVASGVIGILLGCAVSLIFAAVPRPKILAAPEISFLTLFISFIVMVFVGLFAGVVPALRAANMEPVESLRYE